MNSGTFQMFFVVLAALCAFTLPPSKSKVRELVQGAFVPVALPVHAMGLWVSNRLAPQSATDILSPTNPRTVDEMRLQNAKLLTQVANLEAQLDDLRQLSAQYAKLGTLAKLVQPARVVAASAAPRQTLTISTTGLREMHEKMPVVCPLGFVGQIYEPALGGATARVLLASDPASHVNGQFVRYVTRPDGTVGIQGIKVNPPVVDGDGHGMVVRALEASSVRTELKVGDVCLLDDVAFPAAVKGLRLGTIRKITLPVTNAGYAVIELDPTTNFATLAEVLVVDR